MAEPPQQIGQDEIEALLRQSQGGAAPAPAAAAPAPAKGPAPPPSGVSNDDIELLLRKAEQALASIDEPAGGLPPSVQSFKFADFTGSAPNSESATLELMRDVELDLTIELGRTHMHLEDVLKLKQGAVVPLDKLAGDPADIYVNGRLIARGEVLVLNDNFCVRVAELIVGESACAERDRGMEASIQRQGRDRRQRARWPLACWCISCTLLASGCATFRRHTEAAESAGACRQLSREGVAAMERGDPARARTLLDQAVAASPTDVDARRQLAEVLWRSGDAQEALVHVEEAVRLDPTHAPTVVRSGEMLLGVGVADRALERADEALALDPTLASAWALRGCVYRYRGEFDRALADLHQALRYNPNATDVLLDAAELQYQLGRPQRCLTTLQNLLETYPPGEEPRRALWLEGLAYSAVNRPADAVDCLYAASTRGAPEPELLYQLARAQSAAGQPAAAAATARQAADAGHEASRTLLAQLQADGPADTDGTILR